MIYDIHMMNIFMSIYFFSIDISKLSHKIDSPDESCVRLSEFVLKGHYIVVKPYAIYICI